MAAPASSGVMIIAMTATLAGPSLFSSSSLTVTLRFLVATRVFGGGAMPVRPF
jgi:hypothetical protein